MNNSPTKIYAVIGDPVSQSKSPHFQNAGLKSLGLDARYEAIRVTASELQTFFARLRSGEISGVNVTIPHKQAVLNLVDEITPLAKKIGAVNTVFNRDGKLIGDNTDAAGFLRTLKDDLHFDPAGKSIVMIGAGGAARAIAHILDAVKIKNLIIINRDKTKATTLADSLKTMPRQNITVLDWQDISEKNFKTCDLLVNASSLGMGATAWPTLDFVSWLPKAAVVSDVVYHPAETPLVQAAKKCCLIAQNGVAMLLYQGVIAFELFTGKKAPVEKMRQALVDTSLRA